MRVCARVPYAEAEAKCIAPLPPKTRNPFRTPFCAGAKSAMSAKEPMYGNFDEPMYGKLIDRRREPFCNELPAIERPKIESNFSFVFVISNGHTGTTFLGQTSNWRRTFGDGQMPANFYITHEKEADKDVVKKIPWSQDYCKKAFEYVATQKIPQMVKTLTAVRSTRHIDSPAVWFGSGHQIILGLIIPLINLLGSSARFIRLRRNRLDVAYSYFQKNGGPCTHRCIFCICPLDAVARLPVPGALWERLSIYQRYLWFVDELEGQWQAILRSPLAKELKYIEVDWDKKIPPAEFGRMAQFSGMDGAVPLPEKQAGVPF